MKSFTSFFDDTVESRRRISMLAFFITQPRLLHELLRRALQVLYYSLFVLNVHDPRGPISGKIHFLLVIIQKAAATYVLNQRLIPKCALRFVFQLMTHPDSLFFVRNIVDDWNEPPWLISEPF